MKRSFHILFDKGWRHFVACIFMCLCYIALFLSKLGEEDRWLQLLFVLIIGMTLWECATFIYARSQKPKVLVLEEEGMLFNGARIHQNEIEKIMLTHYFRDPTVGILPVKRRWVPRRYVFRFSEDGSVQADELRAWAKEREIKVVYQKFLRW
ncbi:hypothetical protein [Paenibacillus aquistagni]|uniref:hypothetical protein n=1 Tax=Paenibacillus aquistagni TaxID=1852522 RepID=UPI000B5057CB|nr:hypothetical protein [Paenibacillus aquistagni]